MSNQTMALHTVQDGNHTVFISSLRVLLWEESGVWNAQGIEIDYASYGESIEETKANFEKGFALTLKAYLEETGSIDGFLKHTPQSRIDRITNKREPQFNLVKTSELEKSNLPYDQIAYLQAA